ATLATAIGATLLNNLSRALASRASTGNGEEALLIGKLATAAATLAGLNAGTFFRAGTVAGFAVFLAGQLDFRGDTAGGLFEGQRHVIAQISATLRAATSAASSASSEQVLKAEEIAEDVVEILEDGVVKSLAGPGAGKSGMAVSVVNLALLSVAQNAIS